jgi:uncharacterized membrane protein
LPLFLLLSISQFTVLQALNTELLAGEIIHTLVGSIGLILAVPLTTLIAALLFRGNKLAISRQEFEKASH